MIDYNLLNTIPDSESDKLLRDWGYNLKEEYFKLVEDADISSDESIFDFATGTGRICSVLTRFGYNVITGDFTKQDFNKARSRIGLSYINLVKFILLNMEALPFKNSSLKNIVCINTLHELYDPELCLKEMIRVHSGKGKLIISDFNPKGFELMQQIHEVIYGNDHRTGFISMEEVKEILLSNYKNVSSYNYVLNKSYIAADKI